ncbi:conserved hypothetical protein [Pectobacterium parmentieri WPP163]|uniref:hypothetical protein n=1 Tax=Pectobacterium TaxID=122277 RepID=UPI0001B0B740|nr:hypothetical protein [Pectobacterium parmentieri]ACX86475.1 conserved hypothetical protein [Pectobacterium parmentieri WPP163]
MKIYLLHSSSAEGCSFIQDYPDGERSIIGRAMMRKWVPFGDSYDEIKLELRKDDKGKKNYSFDFSGALSPFFVFSDSAINVLNDILFPRGEILPVSTGSKRKNFSGYYPTNVISDALDKKQSVYRVAEHGLIIEKPVLVAKNITDDYLFSIEEDISRVFVTEKFKQCVEEAGLVGFNFSIEIQTS